MAIIDCCHSEEHEDDSFRGATQHFQGVFYSCMGLVRYIGLNIILHGNSTKSYSVENKNQHYKIKWIQNVSETHDKIPDQWKISALRYAK